MTEVQGQRAQDLDLKALHGAEPVVYRGLVADWPAVAAARSGGITAYLRRFDAGAVVGVWLGAPEIQGRFDYNADFTGFNFARDKLPFAQLLALIERHRDDPAPPAIYMGSTTVDTCVPGFRADNDLAPALLQQLDPLASLWLGNRTSVATHQDLPDNLACVVAGRRRFTLFPPHQVGNLYLGPLEHTLAGQPTSLVDLQRPDLQRFPRFAQALEQAQRVELEPGDAIFVPSMWWHGVQALEPVNLLVNYWWRQSPDWMDSPIGALLHAILTVRDLPPAQRQAWRQQFEHYVFDADADTAGHLPEAARQILAPLDETAARGLRARILRRLNR
jgi:hypothetical protein